MGKTEGKSMSERGFRNFAVLQKSKDLAIGIYKVTTNGLFSKDFGWKICKENGYISDDEVLYLSEEYTKMAKLLGN